MILAALFFSAYDRPNKILLHLMGDRGVDYAGMLKQNASALAGQPSSTAR
jgi:hypothetical protein